MEKGRILFRSFIYGWHFLRNWGRRKSACEERKNMGCIAYLVEGSMALNNEMLRDWLGGESSPTPCCGHCSWKKKLHGGLRSDDRFQLDMQEFVSQLHPFRYELPGM